MEEQRLAACAEKLKRLNEKHRQTTEGTPALSQPINEEAGPAEEEESLSAPAPVSSPVPSIPVSLTPATIVQAPLPEEVDQDGEMVEREHEIVEREHEIVEPIVEEEAPLPRQPSPTIQRPLAFAPEPQSEEESSLVEVSALVEDNQVDGAVPIQDYFNLEDNRGEFTRAVPLRSHVNVCLVATDYISFSNRSKYY